MVEHMSSVEGLAKEIQSIPELINAIVTTMQNPIGFVLVLALFGWFVLNRDFSKFFHLFEYKENRRLTLLESYIKDNDIADKNALLVAKEQRDTYYFKIATNGIYAEKVLRNALIELHSKTSSNVSWTTIRRAMPYMELPLSGNVFIREQTKSEKFGKYYNIFVAALFVLIAGGTILLLVASSAPTFVTVIKMVGLSIFFMFAAMIISSQNFPIFAATKIHKELARLTLEE